MAQQDDSLPKVAYLGPQASYTHQAALSKFPPSTHTLQPEPSISSIFTSVQTGQTPFGVIPFENSSNGPVNFTLDLFADSDGQHPEILVTGEIYLPVSHCLVGHAPSDFSRIERLYSHPQAWTQCTKFLEENFKGIERIDVSSTSRGAELVAADQTGTSAAISSSVAARLNDIDILAEAIEDVKGNTTRFLIIQHSSKPTPTPTTSPQGQSKTLVSFRLKHHDHSGALAESLSVFAKHGLNLTSICSRPSREAAWHYVFFVEFRGRKNEDGAVDEALRELGEKVEGWRWLGSWEDALVKG